MNGDIGRCLFFRGPEELPFGHEIRPVKDLISYLATGIDPAELENTPT